MVHIDRRTQRFQDVELNVNINQMQALIDDVVQSSRDRDLRELAKVIQDEGIRRVTGVHRGGDDRNPDRPADPNPHVTLEDGRRRRYHVYLANRGGHWMIVRITA